MQTPKSDTSPLAIASIVSGVIGMPMTLCCSCFNPFSIIAIITGAIALSKVKEGSISPNNALLAKIGIGLGALVVVGTIVMVIIGLAMNGTQALTNPEFMNQFKSLQQ